jgi:phenylalanyl-tRNA synthetase beta chain
LGELHPRLQKKFDLPKAPILFELDVDLLTARTLPEAGEIPRYPSIRRDLAVVVAEDIDFRIMLECMKSESSLIISDISLFDVYRGKGVEHGKKSLAFRILLQDTEKTMTDAQADLEVAKLVRVLEKRFDATLRS